MATLRRGSRGAEVTRLQRLLNERLRPPPGLDVDGDFGPGTEAAVRAFQTQSRLGADGIAGPQTWAALEGGGGTTPPPGPVAGEPAWMPIARQEVGEREVRGSSHNPRIVEYHATTGLRATTDETAWCSSFVNWCLQQAGVTGSNSAAAASWLTWGQSTTARAGAITVIHNPAARNTSLSVSGNHVGFLVRETATHYEILGGNQSNSVRVSSFPKATWQLRGYRWPL